MTLKPDTIAVLKGTWKNFVGIFTGAIITNYVDSSYAIYSGQWWRHVLMGTITLWILTEARYWNTWAKNGKSVPTQTGGA